MRLALPTLRVLQMSVKVIDTTPDEGHTPIQT